jgi:hypothetical protein
MEPLALLISIAGHLRSLIKDRSAKQRDEWDRIAKLCGRVATTVDKMADALDARHPRAELGAACTEFDGLMCLLCEVSESLGPENQQAFRFLYRVIRIHPGNLDEALRERLDDLKASTAGGPAAGSRWYKQVDWWEWSGLRPDQDERTARVESASEAIAILKLAAAKFRAAEAAFAMP